MASDGKHARPAVTVVIPCYNQAEFLPRALGSLSGQCAEGEVEIIVVDDGSHVPLVIPSLFSNLPITLIRQSNEGLSAARNTGIRAAHGKYIKFLDADDTLEPDCLEAQMQSMSDDITQISIIGYKLVSEGDAEERLIIPAFSDFYSALALGNIGPPHIFLYHRALIEEVGGFSSSTAVAGGHEDYDLLLRICNLGGSAITVHKIGATYYKRAGTMSSDKVAMKLSKGLVWCQNIALSLNNLSAPQKASVLWAWYQIYKLNIETLNEPLKQIFFDILDALDFSALPVSAQRDISKILALLQLKGPSYTQNSARQLHNTGAVVYSGQQLDENLGRHYPANIELHPQEIFDWRLRVNAACGELLLENQLEAMSTWVDAVLDHYPEPYVIYGAGPHGRWLAKVCKSLGVAPAFLVDRNHLELSKKYPELKIRGIAHLTKEQALNILIASFGSRQNIIEDLKQIHCDSQFHLLN